MVKRLAYLSGIVLLAIAIIQCTSEKEVNLNLPQYNNTPVIECYLEPGKPYRLLAYYSVGYFDTPQLQLVKNATIQILFEGQTIDLVYDSIPRPGETKLYNYRAPDAIKVPALYNKNFSLSLLLNGTTYTASTIIPNPVPIDSITINCNADQRCQVRTLFTDPIMETNYYRYLSIGDSIGGDVKQDFVINDEVIVDGKGGLGGRYAYNEGQNVVIKFANITKEYYDFLTSVNAAQNSNGNPFAQPANIKSNIPGLIGIFTGLRFDEKKLPVVQ